MFSFPIICKKRYYRKQMEDFRAFLQRNDSENLFMAAINWGSLFDYCTARDKWAYIIAIGNWREIFPNFIFWYELHGEWVNHLKGKLLT